MASIRLSILVPTTKRSCSTARARPGIALAGLSTLPAVLPNFGGSLPNDVFSDTLGLPTIWVPHSYPGCSQHAPDEHILLNVTEEALGIMAGLFWDLGELSRPLAKGA